MWISRRSESHQLDLQNSFPSQLRQPRRQIIPHVQPLLRSIPNELHQTPQDATFLILRSTRHKLSSTNTSADQPLAPTTSSSAEQPAFPTRPATTAVLMPKSTGSSNCTFEAQPFLDERQQKMIVQAVSHKDATVLEAILKDHCPSVLKELKMAFREELKTSCAKLCKRLQGSVLYGNDYESIENFDFNKVWDELKTNHPFLIEIMNAVSGKENSVVEKKLELQVKNSFLYSILMSERWHELNLVKRVNTVLIIEGGCTKQVFRLTEMLVQQFRAKFYKNCGVYGKSTKYGTMIVYDKVNNMGYGPHRDLSHNSKYSMFNFLHQDSSMETRLPQKILN